MRPVRFLGNSLQCVRDLPVDARQDAIKNYRMARKLLRDWEVETERLIDAEQKRQA